MPEHRAEVVKRVMRSLEETTDPDQLVTACFDAEHEAKESELRELETNRGRYYDEAIELHFQRPIFAPMAESMLGGILSELAASFSVSPVDAGDPIGFRDGSTISMVFRDHDGTVVTRRVTRRRSAHGLGSDER